LPSSGDQFASLDLTTESLEPEKFTNYEVGFKWDIFPALAFTAAVYQLDRENTRFNLPNNGGAQQTGASRSEGLEVGLTGYLTDEWQVSGGYAHQKAEITSTSTLGAAGKEVPLVPHDTLTLWNKYMFTREWGAGVGVIHTTDMFAGTDNTVVLPGYTRVDAALYWNVNEHLQAQLNVENLFDETYYPTAHNNNNISPGSPQAFYVTLSSGF
jgi:catecholate siderophore receptor